jgi:hypothetical protein
MENPAQIEFFLKQNIVQYTQARNIRNPEVGTKSLA